MGVRRLQGFTLIELLLVVGILSLLTSVLVPSLARARALARRVVCMNNLRSLGVGSHSYVAAHKGVLPWEGYAEGDRPIRHLGPWEDPSQWFNAMPAYGGDPAYCKLQAVAQAGGSALPRDGDVSHFVCPNSPPARAGLKDDLVLDGYFLLWGLDATGTKLDRRKTYWSYAYNTKLDAMIEDRHSPGRVSLSLNKLQRHMAEIPILVEKIMRPDEMNPPFMTSVGQAATSWREFPERHNKGGYLLFLDNHVAFFTRKQLVSAPRVPMDYNQPGKVIWNPGGIAY